MPHPVNQLKRPLVLKGRYVFSGVGVPIADGWVTIADGRIVAVGPCGADNLPASQEVRDLGNVAILPGLVNAHVHLEFSSLTSPLGQPGISFVDWIRKVMASRRSWGIAREQAVALGLAESLRGGVTTLGEIAQPGWPIEAAASSPLNVTVFQELIAPTAQRVAAAVELARSHLYGSTAGSAKRQLGLSPHAPYSVQRELLSAAVAMSAAEHVPVAMHLAESREELELLRQGTGPLRDLLEELGAWDAAQFRPGTRPLEYLRLLAQAHRSLVIHGNYLDDEEIGFLAANAARMAVVYCPRSHGWFGHSPYPLEKMLAVGVAMALGTDGRGSSPDLSLLAEMRLVARRHPTVAPDRILQMGTILGARALGWDRHVGSIEPGKQADLTIVALPNRNAADPYELLFDSEEPVVACYCRGETNRE